MIYNSRAGLVPVVALLQSMCTIIKAGETEFNALVSRMENDVIKFAREVESLHLNRCSEISLQECSQGNYDECTSQFPEQICPGGEDLNIAQCGDGITCSALWDYSISNVALPSDLVGSDGQNPTDKNVIETICFTQQLDEYFVQQHSEHSQYWEGLDSRTPHMYFGSKNGAFRIYPARHSDVCGAFDARLRPWYIAASSGPKNLVLILDTSGSMEGERLVLMKKAAKQIVNTMTVADRIAVIEFSSAATLHGRDNQFLFTATRENIQLLNEKIDQFVAVGGTNFLDGFTKAFQALDDTITAELHVRSVTAILFLTDGVMTEPADNLSEDNVLNLVSSNIASLQERIGQPAFLFTYSISIDEAEVHDFPKKIACATGDTGVWSKISDDRQIFSSLTSYYQLFALGLGVDRNQNYTAWVEPYPFASGNILGTTVSAPVYDRTKNPHLFLGVVGIDFPLSLVDRVVGNAQGSQDSIDRIVKQSTAFIPVIELELCELESYRRIGTVGDEALCNSTCNATDFVEVEEQQCGSVSDYPSVLFINENLKGFSYEERVCCVVGETAPDTNNQCGPQNEGGLGAGAIAGIAIGGVVGILGIGWLLYSRHKPTAVKKEVGVTPVTHLPPVQPPQNPKYNTPSGSLDC